MHMIYIFFSTHRKNQNPKLYFSQYKFALEVIELE